MNSDGHETSEIELLLPWHAAGTLSRRDAQRVEEALARDPELARRYALVREELGETIGLNESLGAPSAHAMEKLFSAIDAEPKRVAAPLNLGARLSLWIADLRPRTLALGGSIAVVAILLQAGVIVGLALNQGSYQTASAPAGAPGAGAFTFVRFAPQASVDDVNKFLQANKLSIVSGPAPGGLYKVKVADSALPKAELDGLVNRLHQDKIVAFIVSAQ
ncbi:MAG TPA: hypothetical protein VFA57_08605 [Pseudolabrys sp.]|nr:hypothetical protein [Pseudolabrys sp.]